MKRFNMSLPHLLDPVSLLEGSLFQKYQAQGLKTSSLRVSYTKKEHGEAGERAPWLSVVPEDQSSDPSICIG